MWHPPPVSFGNLQSEINQDDPPSKNYTVIILDSFLGLTIADIRHRDHIWCVAVSPNRKFVATGRRDTTAQLCKLNELAPSALIHIILVVNGPEGHAGYVWSVAFSPDSGFLATYGYDGVARLFDVHTGSMVAKFGGGSSIGTPPTGSLFSPTTRH